MALSSADRTKIESWYGDRLAAAPIVSLKAGDRLQSGARLQPLPSGLKVTLSDLLPPYTHFVADADLILVDRNTHVIADVVPGVVR